jgi:hypothetical protein
MRLSRRETKAPTVGLSTPWSTIDLTMTDLSRYERNRECWVCGRKGASTEWHGIAPGRKRGLEFMRRKCESEGTGEAGCGYVWYEKPLGGTNPHAINTPRAPGIPCEKCGAKDAGSRQWIPQMDDPDYEGERITRVMPDVDGDADEDDDEDEDEENTTGPLKGRVAREGWKEHTLVRRCECGFPWAEMPRGMDPEPPNWSNLE